MKYLLIIINFSRDINVRGIEIPSTNEILRICGVVGDLSENVRVEN